jgi:hypothetical protein
MARIQKQKGPREVNTPKSNDARLIEAIAA